MAASDLLTKEELDAAKLAETGDDELEALEEIAGEGDEAKAGDDGDEGEARPERESTFAPTFNAGDPASFDDELKGLREQKAALTKAWRAGEIEDDDYDAKLAGLDDKKDAVIERRATAVAARTMAHQTAEQAFAHDKAGFLREMDKYEGVPYSKTPMLAGAFEHELRAAAQRAIDEKRDPSARELFDEAHGKVVEQMRAMGATPADKPSKADDAKPGAKGEPRRVPPTIGGLPSAARPAVGDDLAAKLATLDGEELELFVARLPADKRRELEHAG